MSSESGFNLMGIFSKAKPKPTEADAHELLRQSLDAAIEAAHKSGLSAYLIASELERATGLIRGILEQREAARQIGSAGNTAINFEWAEKEKARLVALGQWQQ